MIKMIVLGNLGKDAIAKEVNGKNVINFTVAHTEKWKSNDGTQQEKTTWVDCAYWTEKTGVVPYLTKGTKVYVEGQPEAKGYDKQDGTHGVSLTLRVFSIELASAKAAGEPTPQKANAAQPAAASGNGAQVADDLPF